MQSSLHDERALSIRKVLSFLRGRRKKEAELPFCFQRFLEAMAASNKILPDADLKRIKLPGNRRALPAVQILDMNENAGAARNGRAQFLLGVFEGFLAGAGLTILLQRTFSTSGLKRNATNEIADTVTSGFREHARDLDLKRESDATGGDPAELVAANAGHTQARFTRSGGAPGPESSGEILERPGHPGQQMEQADASRPVYPASRTVKIS